MSKRDKGASVLQFLNFGIFPGGVSLCCGFTYAEILAHFRKHKATDFAAAIENDEAKFAECDCQAMYRSVGRNLRGKNEVRHLFFIYFKNRFTFTDEEMCKLAHEILHICQFYLPDVLDRLREREAEAYLHSHIMRQALEALRWGQNKQHANSKK